MAVEKGKRVKVGVMGAGNISDQYLSNLTKYPDVEVVAVADIIPEKAVSQAEKYGIGKSGLPEVVYDDPEIDFVVNITNPQSHTLVDNLALNAGKHVWTEKPLALDLESGKQVLELAREKNLLIGCAPDTVLGPGMQSVFRAARKHLGKPMTGMAMFSSPGPDSWHPNIIPFYAQGAGPILDIGPYYITSLVLALGPVTEVVAGGGKARETRTVLVGEQKGEEYPVEVPTTAQALLRHANGASSLVVLSFDDHGQRWMLEFGGTDGRVVSSDPNVFEGPLEVHTNGGEDVHKEMHMSGGAGRGSGLVNMLRTLREGATPDKPTHISSGELGYHVLEIMLGIQKAVETGEAVKIESTVADFTPLPEDWTPMQTADKN